jgi:choline dehydrogenase-like flavoprotein
MARDQLPGAAGFAMTTRSDPIREGMSRGWRVVDARRLGEDGTFEGDVAIVGSGAGGAMAADILSAAGLHVVLVEEGPLKSSSDFRMLESEAYPQLYQASAARKTRDKAINILQGRCVGGGTTVNWTSSFRTPPRTLAQWRDAHGLEGFGADDLAPWFERVEQRLSIAPWTVATNANNAALARGAQKLGLAYGTIRRNVSGCWNLGYCGMGCPTNAKQSMLVTTIPAALDRGAVLLTRTRAQRFAWSGDRVSHLECVALDEAGVAPTARRIEVRARAYITAGGAINTPALLLRSGVPDPHGVVGRRTFLHPTVVSAALMPEPVEGYAGAPQSVYSDAFLDDAPLDGPVAYKLEAPPIHPILAAITLPGHGEPHARFMRELSHMQVVIALLRDGFHAESPGGIVRLEHDGSPVLDYPLGDYLWNGVRRAYASMAEIQFAAGARTVMPVHARGATYADAATARAAIAGFELAPLVTPVVSAHVMGGCPIGSDARRAAFDTGGRYHHLANLYVADGSLFPTSIGANPQLSIYAIAAKLASVWAREWRA